jgi:DNA-binding MarR family transcriptional regulator
MMADAFTREQRYQERLQEAYDARRSVRLSLTPKQARAIVAFYDVERETTPLPTVLHAAVREIRQALDG